MCSDRIGLAIGVDGWRLWRTVFTICSGVTVVFIAGLTAVTSGPAVGFAAVPLSVILVSPLIWVARFAGRASRSEAWIEADSVGLHIHHPVFLSRDLHLGRGAVHSVFLGEMPGEPPTITGNGTAGTPWKRLRTMSQAIDNPVRWVPAVQPSHAAPDLMSVDRHRGWNFVLILQEPYFLGMAPRRAMGVLKWVSRGSLCNLAPTRRNWVRGLFGSFLDCDEAARVLTEARIPLSQELTPEIVAWLADGPPVALGRALRNYLRDRSRRSP